ncbi:Hypothetical protein POVR2_LOCUS12 [uncultured virus]|nr:Hypothetical protein POVR2_LOCUS12 [uncultured virus]
MDNLDVLRHIVAKLEDSALVNLLVGLQLDSKTASLLLDNLFWYYRSQHLVHIELIERPRADWKTIYWSLRRKGKRATAPLRVKPVGLLKEQYRVGLETSLDLLLVLFEMYGIPDKLPLEQSRDIAMRTKAPDVLEYLIKQGYVVYSQEIAREHLLGASSYSNVDLVQAILGRTDLSLIAPSRVYSYLTSAREHVNVFELLFNILESDLYPGGNIDILYDVARYGSRDVLIFLLNRVRYNIDNLNKACMEAASTENIPCLEMLLSISELSLERKVYILEQAIRIDSVQSMQLILREFGADILTPNQWLAHLYDAVQYRMKNMQILKLILSHSNVADELELLYIATDSSEEIFNTLLSNERIDVESQVYELVSLMLSGYDIDTSELDDIVSKPISSNETSKQDISAAYWLPQHPRVNIEKLDTKTRRLLFYSIRESKLLARASEMSDRQLVELIETRTDLYSVVFRYIFFKRPSAVELLDFFISLHNPLLATAASDILDNQISSDAQLMPIEALLLQVLVPTMGIAELANQLPGSYDEQQASLSLLNLFWIQKNM